MMNDYGKQLLVDLYGCDFKLLNDKNEIKKMIHFICDELDTNIVKEAYHEFEPIGITGFAIISTSHIAIHTWPEFNYAAIDIFSCKEGLPEAIAYKSKEFLKADSCKINKMTRQFVKKRS